MLFKKKTKWFKIFDASFLAGNEPGLNVPVEVRVGDRTVCLVRLPGSYYAVDNKCPHQGASLSRGYCSSENIICPWHHYEFNLKTGRQTGGGGDYVMTYPVELREDGLYIGIEKTVLSLFH